MRLSGTSVYNLLQLCAPLMKVSQKIVNGEFPLLQRKLDAIEFPVNYPKLLAKIEKLSKSSNEEKNLSLSEKDVLIAFIQMLTKLDPSYIKVQTEFFISELEKHLQQHNSLKKRESKTHEIYETEKSSELPFLQIAIGKRKPEIELHYSYGEDIFDLSLDTERNKRLAAKIRKILGKADTEPDSSETAAVKPRREAPGLKLPKSASSSSSKGKVLQALLKIDSEKKQSVTDFLSYFNNYLPLDTNKGFDLVQNPIVNDSESIVYSCQSQKATDLQPFIEISLPKIKKDDDKLKPWKLVYRQDQENREINLAPQLADEKQLINVVAKSMITRFGQQRKTGNFEYKSEAAKLIASIKKQLR